MKTITLKIVLIIFTTLVGICFVILTTIYAQYGIMLLSIELLLLPAMYMVGNELNESLLREDFQNQLTAINEATNEVEEEFLQLMIENEILKKEATLYYNHGAKKEDLKKENRKRK